MKYDGRQNATKQTLAVNVEWPILGESCHRLFCWRIDTWIEVPADKALRSIDLPYLVSLLQNSLSVRIFPIGMEFSSRRAIKLVESVL